jgi:hypothetical protein
VSEELARRYRDLVVFGPFESVDPAEISALEGEIGQAIPPAYRAFIGVANGGSLPKWARQRTRDMSGVPADDFDAYLDSLFIDRDLAEDTWSDSAHLDPDDPWRRVIEEWLDGGMAGRRGHPAALRPVRRIPADALRRGRAP